MIAWLRRPAGRWAFRLLALAISFVVVTRGLGMALDGDGHAFLVAMFLIAWLGFAYVADAFLAVALSFGPVPAPARAHYRGEIPPLSQARQAQVRKLHKAMAEAGVFAPEVPAAELAFASLAANKQRVDWVSVIGALGEADYYHPECDPARWSANMVWDHIPAGWENPPEGKLLAYLWEDEEIIFSWIAVSSLEELGKAGAKATPWYAIDKDMLPIFAEAGIFPR